MTAVQTGLQRPTALSEAVRYMSGTAHGAGNGALWYVSRQTICCAYVKYKWDDNCCGVAAARRRAMATRPVRRRTRRANPENAGLLILAIAGPVAQLPRHDCRVGVDLGLVIADQTTLCIVVDRGGGRECVMGGGGCSTWAEK